MMRDLDLNNPPPSEDVNTNLELGLPSVQVIANQNTNNDEVTIISRRHFEQVASTSRRNQRLFQYTNVGYQRGHTASQSNNNNSLHTLRTTQLIDGAYRIAQWEDHVVKYEDVPEVPPPMQQRAPTFNCPICMEELVEETSTKCGHVFCKRCIVEAMTNERKCPICRRKLKYEDVPEVPPPMQQRAPTFNCPICMEELVEETSTKCGHVFCKRCIVEALTNERKCQI